MSGGAFNQFVVSPRKQLRGSPPSIGVAVVRLWTTFGRQVRDARLARGWSAAELARRAGISPPFVHLIETGQSGSAEAAARIAQALSRQAELNLIDPRRLRSGRASLEVDVVHSAMGELEAAHLRRLGYRVGLDEPYQHYQFAGRADVVAWDVEARALLHIENRSRFPDFQSMAGSFNAKRAYLGRSLGERAGVAAWASETHVIAALWSSEVLHAIRLRTESFRSICPNSTDSFASWWAGLAPSAGTAATLVVLDPLAAGRQRLFISLEDALIARPRYRGYSDAASALERGQSG